MLHRQRLEAAHAQAMPEPRTLPAPPNRRHRVDVGSMGRRLAHFWIVWSALLFVHEGGHALGASWQGLAVRSVTVGAGPVLWRGHTGDTDVVLRLVPLVGLTTVRHPALPHTPTDGDGHAWLSEGATLFGGLAATLALAIGITGMIALRERRSRRRWVWGRILVADALVLTAFNFLPVPPLDGGRAVLAAIAAWRGAALPDDVRFWVQVSGLALAVVPMLLWTRWTARIDAAALWWRAPRPGLT